MQATIYINGVETPIDLPDDLFGADIIAGGDSGYYTITYGRNLHEVGGTLSIPFSATKEAYAQVTLPLFRRLLTAQVTMLDIVGEYGEGAHVEVVDDGTLRIYAHTTKQYTGTAKVMWSARGVV